MERTLREWKRSPSEVAELTGSEMLGSPGTYNLASPPALPVAVELSAPPVVLAAADASKDCWKSPIISSMCSVPTEIRMRSCKFTLADDNRESGI